MLGFNIYKVFGLYLFLLITALRLSAQENCIQFDSIKPNGVVEINLGKITRTQANGYTVMVSFRNTCKQTIYTNKNTTAWNDVADFGRYTSDRVAIRPNEKGSYYIKLQLFHKRLLSHYGTMEFTDSLHQVIAKYRLTLKAEIIDSLLPCQILNYLKLSPSTYDSMHHLFFSELSDKVNGFQQLQKVKISNDGPYTMVVKNRKRWDLSAGILEDDDSMLSKGRFCWREASTPDTIAPGKFTYLYISPKYYRALDTFQESKVDTLEYDLIDQGGVIERRKLRYDVSAYFKCQQFEIKELSNRKEIFDYCKNERFTYSSNDTFEFKAIVITNLTRKKYEFELAEIPKDKRYGWQFFDKSASYITHINTAQKFVNFIVNRSQKMILEPFDEMVLFYGIPYPQQCKKCSWKHTRIKINGKEMPLQDWLEN